MHAMKKIRNAIVGLGRIGSILEDDRYREKPCTHAGAIALNPDCVLAAGCDIAKNRQKLFIKRWNCHRVYSNIDDMLKEENPDILHIATPPDTHFEMVEKALYHNVKLAICEKPLAENRDDAFEIARIHRSVKMIILTNHERRYSKDYVLVKKHIKNKTFGSLLSIYSKLYMEQNEKLYKVLLHDGTHLVDIIQFLTTAKLKKISVQGSLNRSTGTSFIFSNAGHVPCIIEVGAGRNHLVFELDLSFASGRIKIGNGLYEEYASDTSPYYEGVNSLKKKETAGFSSTGYFSNMLKDAVKCLKNSSHTPVSSAIDGYNAVAFISSLTS